MTEERTRNGRRTKDRRDQHVVDTPSTGDQGSTEQAVAKRVLLLAAHLPDGGINTHMLTLGTGLRRLGWEVAICSGSPLVSGKDDASGPEPGDDTFPPLPRHYERAGISHFPLSIPDPPHRLRDVPGLVRLPLAMRQVIRATRMFRPGIVHCHTRQMGYYARTVQALMGVPFVATMHNPVPPKSRLFARTTLMGARAIGVSGEIGRILTEEYGFPADRVVVVIPGVDAERFRPPHDDEREAARQRFGIGPDEFVLAFVGSLIPRKRPDTLVEAMPAILAEEPRVVALLAGRGADEEELRRQASALGVDGQVRFLGYQDTRTVLWASDAFVLPSDSEGSPLVLVEAMLSGVPVIATPVGGILQQITPAVSGTVFPPGDHEALARSVIELIRRPREREAMATQALQDARDRFSSAGMARTTEGIYLDVIAEHRRR
jgi:glycosyltransferase involved in cell wall biosynthesis